MSDWLFIGRNVPYITLLKVAYCKTWSGVWSLFWSEMVLNYSYRISPSHFSTLWGRNKIYLFLSEKSEAFDC